jgi:hypothetical protein
VGRDANHIARFALLKNRNIFAGGAGPVGQISASGRADQTLVGANDNLKIIGRTQRRGLVAAAQFLFGLMIEFLVPALGLAGLLPQFVGAMDDLFFGGIFHFSLSGWKARGLRAIAGWISLIGSGRRGCDFFVRQGFGKRTRRSVEFGGRTWLSSLLKLDFLGHGRD